MESQKVYNLIKMPQSDLPFPWTPRFYFPLIYFVFWKKQKDYPLCKFNEWYISLAWPKPTYSHQFDYGHK